MQINKKFLIPFGDGLVTVSYRIHHLFLFYRLININPFCIDPEQHFDAMSQLLSYKRACFI